MAKLENKTKENPKLEQNVLSDGRISLYLEYYLGREETPILDDNGNPVLYETGKMTGKPKGNGNRTKKRLSWLPRSVQSVNSSLRRACLAIA